MAFHPTLSSRRQVQTKKKQEDCIVCDVIFRAELSLPFLGTSFLDITSFHSSKGIFLTPVENKNMDVWTAANPHRYFQARKKMESLLVWAFFGDYCRQAGRFS